MTLPLPCVRAGQEQTHRARGVWDPPLANRLMPQEPFFTVPQSRDKLTSHAFPAWQLAQPGFACTTDALNFG